MIVLYLNFLKNFLKPTKLHETYSNNKPHFHYTNLVIHHPFIVYNINQNHPQHNSRQKYLRSTVLRHSEPNIDTKKRKLMWESSLTMGGSPWAFDGANKGIF